MSYTDARCVQCSSHCGGSTRIPPRRETVDPSTVSHPTRSHHQNDNEIAVVVVAVVNMIIVDKVFRDDRTINVHALLKALCGSVVMARLFQGTTARRRP